MSEYEELSEKTEEAKAPFDKKVAATMAIIAAALAIVSVLGQVLANEELLTQQKASDQWSYYQAKSIRRYESEITRDLFQGLKSGSANVDVEGPAKYGDKYGANLDRYEKDGQEIQGEAQKLEAESQLKGRQALRFHIGEVFLEIGIVFASLAILTKRTLIWGTSMVSAGVGVAIAATAVLVH
jgi:hypothetical protein